MIYTIGLIVLLIYILRVINFIWQRRFYLSDNDGDLSKYAENDGYAVVTGATGGLGKQISEHLASRGINLYMIDMNGDALASVSKEFETKYKNIKVLTKQLDLTTLQKQTAYDELDTELAKLNVTVLVNNAGLGELTTGRIHGYHKHPLNELCLMSNLNAVVPSIMFKMVLPRMESNKLGLCIMMGSGAGMAPIGTLPTYGATKSFVMHLTKSLRHRYPYETTGINFHLFTPHFIQTAMCAELNLGPDWFKNSIFPKPDQWAKSAMKSLDQNRINADIGGYPLHEVLCAVQRNWVYLCERTELFQYYTNIVCTGQISLKNTKSE